MSRVPQQLDSANTILIARSITCSSAFTGISSEQFKEIVSTGADDEEIAAWVGKHGKPRERIEIIRWNNDLRYKRLSELPDGMQEYMEDYIPQFVPPPLRHHIDYFFDVYDAEEKRMET